MSHLYSQCVTKPTPLKLYLRKLPKKAQLKYAKDNNNYQLLDILTQPSNAYNVKFVFYWVYYFFQTAIKPSTNV